MEFTGLKQLSLPPAAGGWTRVRACPACGSAADHARGAIPERDYVFGAAR